ncbi:MAG: sigma-70 family RNA polymerase sigma factor [Cetobacterium sp.]|uniref:sigma-70 family RNA polymerase sigma factor n=1 Tax=Cetobacterium sp. TaxID=2071632 RepID=UPI003F3577E0
MLQQELKIICLAKENDHEAIEILIKKYKKTTLMIIREYNLYLIGMEIDDFIQEGNIGILKAIKYFNEEKNVKFSSFVKLCIKSEIISFVKKYSRKRHVILTNAIYNKRFIDPAIEDEVIIENLYPSNRYNPEKLFFLKVFCKELKKFFIKELSSSEQQILILLANGYSYKDIYIELKKEPKKIDNTIQRIRQKLKKYELDKLFYQLLN